jgi:hypothetical protein
MGERGILPRYRGVRDQCRSQLLKADGLRALSTAKSLLITADGAAESAHACGFGRFASQKLADELVIEVTVCHLPSGTSKWNKIEHHLFELFHQPENVRGIAVVRRDPKGAAASVRQVE